MSASRRFQFIKLIASGGFGDVYLCKEFNPMGVSRLVAMKLLKSRWSENEEIVKRIRDEARLLALLRHHNIINVFDMTSIQGRTAVVMEYLEAIDLGQIIAQMKEMKRRVPLKVCLEMVAYVASALDAAFNQPPFPGEKPLRVIHRDIKPSNIMLDADGVVKVLDFGVAHSNFDGRESETRELQFGSIGYMAPERLFSEPETSACDVYSLGSTLFEAISSIPFGKALATKEKHTDFVHKRINQLLSVLKLESKLKEALFALLSETLAFDSLERISANDLVERARRLSRSLKGPNLEMWSQKAVVHLRNAFAEPINGSLNGEMITEDSTAFKLNQTMVQRPEPQEHDDNLEEQIREQAHADMTAARTSKESQSDPLQSNYQPQTRSTGTGIYQSLSGLPEAQDSEALAAASPLEHERAPVPVIDESPSEMLPLPPFSQPDANSDHVSHISAPTVPPPPLPPPSQQSQIGNQQVPLPPDIESDTAEITHFDTSIPGFPSPDDVSVSEGQSVSQSEPEIRINPTPMTIPAASPTSSRPKFILVLGILGLLFLLLIGYAVFWYVNSDQGKGKVEVKPTKSKVETSDSSSSEPPQKTKKKKKKKPIELYEAKPDEKTITIFSTEVKTTRLILDCGNNKFKGKDKVISPLKNSKNCTVMGSFDSFPKKMSQIKNPKPGIYNCFSKGKKGIVSRCKLQ